MRVGVVIDSACDLPAEYLNEQNIGVLPVNLQLGKDATIDVRNPIETVDFYSRYATNRQSAVTTPPSTEQIVEWLSEYAANQFDRLLIITISSTRSKIFEQVINSQLPLLNKVRQLRKRDQMKGSFFLRVHDSKTLFTGQAVLVHEMVRLLRNESIDFDDLCREADMLSDCIHAYLIPKDLYYVRKRASQKGEKSVSWLRYRAGTLLDMKPIIRAHQGNTDTVTTARGFDKAVEKLTQITMAAIDKGLKTSAIAISYAGDPKVIASHAQMRVLAKYAHKKGIEVMTSVMSTTAGVHVGPGALSLAFAV